MKLVHYAHEPIQGPLRLIEQPDLDIKPEGLWVSDDDRVNNWPWYAPAVGAFVYDVTLAPDHSILVLQTEAELHHFRSEFPHDVTRASEWGWIDWRKVADRHGGLIITPWRKFVLPAPWYLIWDCSSGCIWDPAMIASFTLREKRDG